MGCDVVIVIVTHNSEASICALLDSIPAALSNLRAEVIVVDNGSSDRTREIVERRADARLVQSRNHGYAAGFNRGAELAGGNTALLLLNPDVVLSPGSVPPLVSRLAEPGAGVVVPRVIQRDGVLDLSLRREPTLLRALGLGRTGAPIFSEYVTEASAYLHTATVDWALGAAIMVSRNCLNEVGPWDQSYFLYSEETDFCLRARDLGWRTVYEPESQVMHEGGGSGRNDRTHVMQIVNRVRLYRRRHRAAAAWIYLALTVLSELSWVIRGHSQSRASLRALLHPAIRPAELQCSGSVMPR